VAAPDVQVIISDQSITVAAGDSVTEPLRVIAPASKFTLGHADITLRISSEENLQIDRECRLLGPIATSPPTSGASNDHR